VADLWRGVQRRHRAAQRWDAADEPGQEWRLAADLSVRRTPYGNTMLAL